MTSPSDAAAALLNHRFLLFTGKGGTGKTTVVASLAVHAAAAGMRPLVVELGHRESMRAVFGVPEIGFNPRDVGHGVHALSIDVELAVLDYMMQHIPSRRVAKAILNNKVLERLFKAMPAVGEIATVNKLRVLESENDHGVPRWSPILVDLDATGHALMFLELRAVLDGLIGAGPMLKLIESTSDLFADPAKSRLCLVTTPDELPVTETIELFTRLRAAGTVAFGSIYANRVPPVVLPNGALPWLDSIHGAARSVDDVEIESDVAFARLAISANTRGRNQLERLRENIPLPVVELPLLPSARIDEDALARLGALAALAPVPAEVR